MKCSAIVCKMLAGFTHGSLVKLDLSLSEVGHLLERVDWYQHGADVRLSTDVKEFFFLIPWHYPPHCIINDTWIILK